MKRILLTVLTIVLTVALAACGNGSSDNKSSKSKDDKTLVVGTEGTYAPLHTMIKKET